MPLAVRGSRRAVSPNSTSTTQWVQSRMMLTRSSDPQQQSVNRAMNFLPLIVIPFAAHVSSGLSLYRITSTLVATLLQSRIVGWGLLPDTVSAMQERFAVRAPR